MVHSTAAEWCDSRPKAAAAVVAVKEKRAATAAATAAKNGGGRESKAGAGSRRIFSPVFKLQVLDSYRQDADCQGNQRATARKYGIHRRQIQKWLQMETNLRLSVQKTSASALNLTSSALKQSDHLHPAKDCSRTTISSSSGNGSSVTCCFAEQLEVKPAAPPCSRSSTSSSSSRSSSAQSSVGGGNSSSSNSSLPASSPRAFSSSARSSPSIQGSARSTPSNVAMVEAVTQEVSVDDSEEYVNVDEITDSEADDDYDECEDEGEEAADADTSSSSSCSSTLQSRDKALDLSSATLSKRRFYTADFKAHVLDAFRRDLSCRGNQRATARKFGIHRRQVQKWLNQEAVAVKPSEPPIIAAAAPPAAAVPTGTLVGDSHCSFGSTCLDLSSSTHKRKADEPTHQPVHYPHHKRAKRAVDDETTQQESALCLVKHTTAADRLLAAKLEPADTNDGHYHDQDHTNHLHHILYPAAAAAAAATLEHTYSSTTSGGAGLGYLKPDYPFCVYQPWHCCYQQILSARNGFDAATAAAAAAAMFAPATKAYSYAFNVKYEASYVDIPVQYGFGDSVPSKWLKENPLFLRGPPSPYPCP